MTSAKSQSQHALQRIRINADGYDASGAYWGTGPDVFIATSADGADEITVRARNVKEARAKIAGELARQPGTLRETSDKLGGNAPRKTRYEIQWTDPVSRSTIKIRVAHARDYLASGTDHLEIEAVAPVKAALPITETGYRSHFLPPLELINAGGPVTFVTAWLAREATSTAWQRKVAKESQGDLFQWAEANGEVVKLKRTGKNQPDGSAARRRAVTPPGKKRRSPTVDAG